MDPNQKTTTVSAQLSVAQTPALPKQPEKLQSPRHTSWGALIGIIIIVFILIVGALYFFGARLVEQDGIGVTAPETI